MPLNMICLFVLASKQGVSSAKKPMESPLPSLPSALGALAQLCLVGRWGKDHVTIDRLKTIIPLAGPWPEGSDSGTQLPGKWGWVQAREALCPSPAIQHREDREELLAGFCSQIPAPALCAHRGKAPAPWGSSLSPNLSSSEQGEEGCWVWPGDAIRNHSNSFLVQFQKFWVFFFSPSFLLLDCRG